MNITVRNGKNLPRFKLVMTTFLTRSTSKIAVEVESDVLQKLENDETKPKHQPGIVKTGRIELPAAVKKALQKVIGDHPVKALQSDCKRVNRYISSRHPPAERNEVRSKMSRILEEVEQKMPAEKLASLGEEEAANWRRKRDQIINRLMAQRTYAWKPIIYNSYEALVYAVGRGALEYSVLMRILKEIQLRDVNFQPRSYLDFGSGVGTGMWAASNFWKDSIYEYFNVDKSREMHDLSDLILREGNENQKMTLNNVFYRQFLPSIETKYDLIVSSYSLFELESAQQRAEIIRSLWSKCDGYLVIVEEGTRKGSELVIQARDYLLRQEDESLKGHVVAPCPHNIKCPRLMSHEDNTPCNFEQSYLPFEMGNSHLNRSQVARYTYVVLKKGASQDATSKWPRLVRPTLLRSRHAICRMCTADGKLQEIIFTQAKHGRPAYRCAKASNWGDRLPIEIGETYETPKKERRRKEEKDSESTS